MDTKKIHKQVNKVMDELYKLHFMLPDKWKEFYISEGDGMNLITIAQLISLNVSLNETDDIIEREMGK